MQRNYLLIFILLASSGISSGQLVIKKDYDAAFSLQAGLGSGIAVPDSKGHLPAALTSGFKMTFPFTRKWFLGAEVNYNGFRAENLLKTTEKPGGASDEAVFRYTISSIQVPVYARVMMVNNKTSLLFGGYYAFHSKPKIERQYDGEFRTEPYKPISRSTGVVAGVEQIIGQNLYLTFKINGSVTNIAPKAYFESKLYPLQASLTISYDLLRIGDCGCY